MLALLTACTQALLASVADLAPAHVPMRNSC
jgi:hypothetical protein